MKDNVAGKYKTHTFLALLRLSADLQDTSLCSQFQTEELEQISSLNHSEYFVIYTTTYTVKPQQTVVQNKPS
jgi:hypothetical protein